MRTCFHCNLPIPDNVHAGFMFNDQYREFCCVGCEAVAGTIIHGGLSDYYKFRSQPAVAAPSSTVAEEKLALYDRIDVLNQYATFSNQNTASIILLIEGITCAACTWLIEHQLQKIEGVESIQLNLSTHRATLTWQTDKIKLSTLLKKLARIGYQAEPYQAERSEALWLQEQRTAIKRLGVAGIGMMQIMMYAASLYIGDATDISTTHESFLRWVSLIITTPVLLYAGHPFLMGAWRDVRTHQLTMDIPITISIWLAYFASVYATLVNGEHIYFDSVSMFIFFLLVSRYFEMRTRHRYAQSSNHLEKLLPQTAWRLQNNESTMCLTSDLQIDDVVLVKAGHTIPVDGIVISGESAVNEASLTGEYAPVIKKNGDAVSAGTLNTESALTIQTKRLGNQSTLSTIVRLLERAQSEKPYLAQMADKIARWFIVVELLIAAIVGITWAVIDPSRALWIAISVLIVTCPCALSLAIPTALTAATTALRKNGILITRGHVLESVNQITHIVFDKTGTLTEGAFAIEKMQTCSILNEDECLQIGASLEAYSEHPIARAFVHLNPLPVYDAQTHTNAGISGNINNHVYKIGTPAFALTTQTLSPPDNNHQWLLLADENQAVAWFALGDHVRPQAASVIEQLKKMGLNITLLTGDNSPAAVQVANTLNIKNIQQGVTPQQKLDFIRDQQQRGECILMVGDGINDVLGLARAHISVAMGLGSDLTRTQSDVVLLNNDLRGLLTLFEKAKNTRRIIHQNLFWTLVYNISVIPLAALGLMTPYWATVGMSFSSIFVVTNAIRLSKTRK